MFGDISGGHVNPALTLSFVLHGILDLTNGILYVISQFAGGIVGAALVRIFLSDVVHNATKNGSELGINRVAADYEDWRGFFAEIIMMSIFTLVIWGNAI